MRFAALLSLAAVAAGALTPSPVPQFETLFVGQFIIGPDSGTIDTPFGTRIYATVLGGNFTDPSGNLVATMLPGTTDTGFVNVNPGGLFFPDAVIVWRWEVDQTLAYIRTRGVGVLGASDLAFWTLETGSETYQGLNGRFLVANATTPGGVEGSPVLTVFGAI